MDGVIRHQIGVELAVLDQQGFIIGTRQMDTALVDGYPRRQDVKSLHLITHCFSVRFGFGPGVASREPSRGRELYREDWPSMAGGFGVEAEVCIKAMFPAVPLIASCLQKCGLAVSRVRHIESVDSLAPG